MPAPPAEIAARRARKQEQEYNSTYYSNRRLFLAVMAIGLVLSTLMYQKSWISAFQVQDLVAKVKVNNANSTTTGLQVQPETKSWEGAIKEAAQAQVVSTTQAPETTTTAIATTTQADETAIIAAALAKPKATPGTMEKPEMITSLKVDEPYEEAFCQPWNVDMDGWWAHHPKWEPDQDSDNATHQCFRPIPDPKKAQMIFDLFWTQFVAGNCSEVITKIMWSSGYGADFDNVVDGLWHALQTKKPVQMAIDPWHYADNSVKQKQTPETLKVACPRRNMFCYFLETCKCEPTGIRKNGFLGRFGIQNEVYPWIAQFAMRQRTWLRKLVADYVREQQSRFTTPCTVIHVRRGDVVLHGKYARKYHPIEEYLDFAKNQSVVVHNNILIMTDDANAIPEAKTKFPQYNWMSVDRPRKASTEAKWEQHLASNDPIFEMVVLQASFRIVQQCDQIIHTRSSFGHTLANQMKLTGKNITQLDMDAGKEGIYNENNTATKNNSHAYRRRGL